MHECAGYAIITYASASQGLAIICTGVRSSLYMAIEAHTLLRSRNSSQIPNCLKRAATDGPIWIAEPTNAKVLAAIEHCAKGHRQEKVFTKWFDLFGSL